MNGYYFLTLNKENFIIIFGEKLCNNEIIVKGKLSFFDAIRFSDSSAPQKFDFPFHFIRLTCTPNETIHFHDPLLYQKFKIIINEHSLIIIDSENSLTTGAVFNIFNHFLFKKGRRMLFLTDVPNDKIHKNEKDKVLRQSHSLEHKQEC